MISLEGRTVLVTGGSAGSGLALVRETHRLGADVIVGTRRADHFAAVSDALGGKRIHPFVVDITDEQAVSGQLRSLASQEVKPTDLVHCAAGGLEPVIKPLIRRVIALRRLPAPQLAGAMEAAREEARQWAAGTRESAMRVNYEAARALIEQVADDLPAGGSVIFYSSLWSTFWGRAGSPVFYHGIAESKHALELWLEDRSEAWARRGITTAIISGHLVVDTAMGELFDRFLLPLMPENQARFRSFFITSADMVRATLKVLTYASGREEPRPLTRLYVVGPGQILEHLPPDALALADVPPF